MEVGGSETLLTGTQHRHQLVLWFKIFIKLFGPYDKTSN